MEKAEFLKWVGTLQKREARQVMTAIMADWDICDQCGQADKRTLMMYECEAYKQYTETLCGVCARHCKSCSVFFGASGAYHHDDCERGEDDKDQ